ncbi:MAG TPA: hypothetical protein VJZ31_02930 [Bacilli bacterium]|nr:hypothetical protein [Bacilli bacterium]
MKRNKLLVLGLSFVSVLAACGPLTSTESSEPVSESGLSSETVTSLPSETTTSQAPTSATSTAPAFNRDNSITLPVTNASDGAPVYSGPMSSLPSGVVQPTEYMNQVNDVFWPVGFDALNTFATALTDVQKVLVVPVSFTDQRKAATEKVRQDIGNTFFGKASDTGWESVASFYYKSSRGQLTLTGEVTPWIDLGIRTRDLADSSQIEAKVIKKIYATLPADMLREYDLNEDGYLDALWIVYGADIKQNNNDTYWAFVSWVYNEGSMNKPYPGVFGWTSYKFMYEGGEAELPQFQGEAGKLKVDAHTFIHETGHMLGLTDYYDYDSETNPSGGIDMMGNNIIDHNAYSKFLYNWNQPLVPNGITEETTITLRPATTSGDFILLNTAWNGSVFDEYILLEYYTPTELNYQDSAVAYNTNYSEATGHNTSGVRAWHVDSRLWAGPIVDGWFSFKYQVDPVGHDVYANVIDEENDAVYFGASNTGSESVDPAFDILKLIDAAGAGAYYNNYRSSSSNSSLFKTGQEITDWNVYLKNGTGKFNDGSDIGFSVKFGAMDANGIEIILNKTI